MRQVHARVSESDPCVRSREQHLRAGFIIRRIGDRTDDELRDHPKRLQRPDIADRIRALICGSQRGAIGTRTAGIRECGERFDRVTENVETTRRRNLGRHRPRVVGIEQAKGRLETTTRDAGLRVQPSEIEDADTGRFTAGTGRRRDRDQWLQRSWNRQTLPHWRVHVVEKVGRRIRRVKVDGFRRIDRRPATDGNKRVARVLLRKGDRVGERLVRRLDTDAVVDHRADSARVERFHHGLHRLQLPHCLVGQNERMPNAELCEVESHFARHTGAEANGGRRHLECGVVQ